MVYVRRVVHSLVLVLLALPATLVLAVTHTMTPLVALTATALIMGGTTHPLSGPTDSPQFIHDYVNGANNNYILVSGFCGDTGCTPTAVSTPEQFWPQTGTMTFDQSVGQGVTNLNSAINAQPASTPIVVYGYSQSARIASIEKANLAATNPNLPVSFVLVGNPNRPNGGILERFNGTQIPILGVTFDGATPTNTNFKTVDVTRQYDGWADFPNNPLNPLADLNAAMGIYYVHGNYGDVGLSNALYQGQYGDTKYYMIPAGRLPLLTPLAQAGVPDPALAVVDAPLRVLVETGYDRTISPGAPTPAMLLYFPNPVQTGVNFIIAIPTGLDDGAQEAINVRPFGTTPAGPYGVGGPPVNAGTFDSTGSPTVASSPTTAGPNTNVLADKAPAPGAASAPEPAVGPERVQSAAQVANTPPIPTGTPAKPLTGNAAQLPAAAQPGPSAQPPAGAPTATLPSAAKPGDIPASAPKPVEMPSAPLKPADRPTALPKPAEFPTLAPFPTMAPKPVEVPTPPKPAQVPTLPKPAAAPTLPEAPALPEAPKLPEAPALPEAPQLPAPQLPAPPPLPAFQNPLPPMPAPPPLPALPALPSFHIPFFG